MKKKKMFFKRSFEKEYGNHKYPKGGGKCEYGCGCSITKDIKDPRCEPGKNGPEGLHSFELCPNNPKNGKLLGGYADYAYVLLVRLKKEQKENSKLIGEIIYK